MSKTKTTDSGIAYHDAGSGSTAIVCLPGWCGPKTVFDPLVPLLAKEHRVLSVDWRGHGESAAASRDFGSSDMVDDVVEVLEHSGVATALPLALSHAGWVATELRSRLGADRIPKLVLLDWMVLGAPGPFRDAITAMSQPPTTRPVVEQLLGMWSAGLDIAELEAYLKEMATTPDEMWQRAAREIGRSFDAAPSPLEAIGSFDPPPRTLHLYAQPPDAGLLAAQEDFAAGHPWFTVERLAAQTHFPMFEVPDAMARSINAFLK